MGKACLNQHLIAIRWLGICGDHVRSGTSLIAIIYVAGQCYTLHHSGVMGAYINIHIAASAASWFFCGQ